MRNLGHIVRAFLFMTLIGISGCTTASSADSLSGTTAKKNKPDIASFCGVATMRLCLGKLKAALAKRDITESNQIADGMCAKIPDAYTCQTFQVDGTSVTQAFYKTDAQKLEEYDYSDCPCEKRCVSSGCSGGGSPEGVVCTEDCGGPGSCSCSRPKDEGGLLVVTTIGVPASPFKLKMIHQSSGVVKEVMMPIKGWPRHIEQIKVGRYDLRARYDACPEQEFRASVDVKSWEIAPVMLPAICSK